jgi:hypothetical protein
MTTITYTYEITRVDPDAKAMDILYTSPEYGTMLVGARMPWEGETVDMIASMYSPVRNWVEQTLAVASVAVGAGGEVAISLGGEEAAAPTTKSKLDLVRAMRAIDHGEVSLWDTFKAQIALADEATQEDWQIAAELSDNDPVLVAVMTTIYGDEAAAQIAAIYGSQA